MSIERFLRQRAVDLMMDGTYMLSNWYDPQGRLRTFACRATRVSPFRMIVEVPVVGKVGDSLTSYFQDFGHFEGTISDTTKGGLLLELEMTQAMRARLAEKLIWLEKKTKDPFSISEARKNPRFVPKASQSTLTLADGTVHGVPHHRRLDVRRCGVGRNPAADRNAACDRRLHWPRHQAFSERIRRQVRQGAKPRRTEPPDRADGAGLSASFLRAGLVCRGLRASLVATSLRSQGRRNTLLRVPPLYAACFFGGKRP